jgi:DNA-binding transcriptional LysR family regulator
MGRAAVKMSFCASIIRVPDDMITLDLYGLRCFVAVIDAASFSLAAKTMRRTQSAISLQVARLEQVLGKVLIDRRQGRVLGLTDDGRELLAYARQLLALNDAACQALTRPTATGRVRLGVPADFMDKTFPDLLRRFQDAHGGVEIEVVSDVSERLREQAHEGHLDVAFFKQRPGDGNGAVVARQRLVWVGGPMAAPASPVEPLPLILFPEGCVFRSQILSALEGAGRRWRVAYACGSMASVQLAIRQGVGISALPQETLSPDLVELDDPELPPVSDVDLAVVVRPNCGPAANLLADHISRHIREREATADLGTGVLLHRRERDPGSARSRVTA